MKKIFTLSIVALLAAVLITSCTKERFVADNDYWLSQERGTVVYSSSSCGYYVVETNYGYTIIRNLDGLIIYDGDVMYGDFGNYGTRNFYNYNANVVTGGSVVEYDLSYNAAQDAIDYYCPYGKSTAVKIRETGNAKSTAPRAKAPANQ